MTFYKPVKLLSLTVLNKTPLDSWPYNEGDEFWVGGNQPRAYRWVYECGVEPQQHSSPNTSAPFVYDGRDITVGDWVSDISGRSLRITSINTKSSTDVTVVVEDVERYNTINDTSRGGDGSLRSTSIFCFELDSEYMPILGGIPSHMSSPSLMATLYSRFQRYKATDEYLIKKINHSFKKNDVLVISPSGDIVKHTDATTKYPLVGSVSMSLQNRFYMRPVNKIIDNISPSLPGTKGQFIYANNNGELTANNTGRRMYLQMSDPVKSSIHGSVSNPILTENSTIEINTVNIISNSTSLSDIIDAINQTHPDIHNVIASESAGENSVSSLLTERIYGLVAGVLPMKGAINGVIVEFTTTESGSITVGLPTACDGFDMVADINNMEIPNIVASYENDILTIKDSTGGAISLTNVQADIYGYEFAGTASCTGLPLSTPSSSDTKILLERLDGGEIAVADIYGSLTSELGIYSVENGKRPTGMIVENWDRTSNMYVVETPTDRDLIDVVYKGDEVFVNDSGNGEWSKWLYDGFQWKLIATEDSARTDADVLHVELTYTSAAISRIGTVSNNSRVTNVSIEVTEAFDDATATLNIGDEDDMARLMSESVIDLTVLGTYTFTPSHVYSSGMDTDLNAYLNPANSMQGSLKVIISYS